MLSIMPCIIFPIYFNATKPILWLDRVSFEKRHITDISVSMVFKKDTHLISSIPHA